MAQRLALLATLGTATAALGACTPAGEVPEERGTAPVYQGVKATLLDDDLVQLGVTMQGARDEADVEAYGRCAVAQYAQDQGFGYVRQVRTIVTKTRQTWYGDAVYLMSPTLPEGLRTIEVTQAITDCATSQIPTV